MRVDPEAAFIVSSDYDRALESFKATELYECEVCRDCYDDEKDMWFGRCKSCFDNKRTITKGESRVTNPNKIRGVL